MTHPVLVVEQLHVRGGETEDVGAQGDKPEEETEVLGKSCIKCCTVPQTQVWNS